MKPQLRRARRCPRCLIELIALLAMLVVILTRRRRTLALAHTDAAPPYTQLSAAQAVAGHALPPRRCSLSMPQQAAKKLPISADGTTRADYGSKRAIRRPVFSGSSPKPVQSEAST
jgi:hypothetical protein